MYFVSEVIMCRRETKSIYNLVMELPRTCLNHPITILFVTFNLQWRLSLGSFQDRIADYQPLFGKRARARPPKAHTWPALFWKFWSLSVFHPGTSLTDCLKTSNKLLWKFKSYRRAPCPIIFLERYNWILQIVFWPKLFRKILFMTCMSENSRFFRRNCFHKFR